MIRVRFTVLRLRRYASDAWLELYGDLGGGELDYAHPLGPGPIRFWPEAGGRGGHLCDAHLSVRHLDAVDPDGHLETAHLESEHLWPAWPIVVESPAYVFGKFDHAIRVYDEAGNVAGDAPLRHVVVVNSAPAIPRGLKHRGSDPATSQVTFSFHGSRFAAIRGV